MMRASWHGNLSKRKKVYGIVYRNDDPEPRGDGLLLDLCEDDLPRAAERRYEKQCREQAAELIQLMPMLPQREREVVDMRMRGCTLSQIGQALKLSKERVRQIENRGYRRLYLILEDQQ